MSLAESNTVFGRFGSPIARVALPDEVSIEELLAFERMLADLSARFASVSIDQVEFEIQLAQTILRQFLEFDRCTYLEFQKDGTLAVLSSSAIDSVGPMPLGPFVLPLPWYISRLNAGETVVFQADAGGLPPEAAAEAEYWRKMKLRSHLSVPLRVDGRIAGVIAFSAFQ